jgi:uncharacterized protein with PIN domain
LIGKSASLHIVLDACAIIAFLRDEPGSDVVRESLADESAAQFAHAVKMYEALYVLSRGGDEDRVRMALDGLIAQGLDVREDMDTTFWHEAGSYKARIRRVSLADCFAITGANRLDAEVLTSDHHEFDPIAAGGVCRVRVYQMMDRR